MATVIDIKDWKSLRSAIGDAEGKCAWGCRGEPGDYPHRRPTLDRCTEHLETDLRGRLLIEYAITKRFQENAKALLPHYELELLDGIYTLWMLMRHYGAPTRVLDWTSSLWIAAYFAAASEPKCDGRVFCFDRYAYEEAINAKHEVPIWRARRAAEVVDEWQSDGSLLVDGGLEIREQWVSCEHLFGVKFPRLAVQQGFFTIASHPFVDHWSFIDAYPLPPDSAPAFELCIKREAKPSVLQGLQRMGITAASLYPGVQGLAMSLVDFAQYSHRDIGVKQLLGRHWRRVVDSWQ